MRKSKSLIVVVIFIIICYISISIFFLNEEFTENQYQVEVTKCSGEIETLYFSTKGGEEAIHTYREAVPVLQIGKKKFVNVCEYRILSKNRIN